MNRIATDTARFGLCESKGWPIEYKTLEEWFDQVKSWKGGAKLYDTRSRPTTGIF